MRNVCPFCNWEIYKGKCTNEVSHCRYTGVGVAPSRIPVQVNQESYNWTPIHFEDTNNGVGCYDNDADFS